MTQGRLGMVPHQVESVLRRSETVACAGYAWPRFFIDRRSAAHPATTAFRGIRQRH